MSSLSTQLRLAVVLLVIALLAACAPAAPATPDPEEVAAQVATSVALTVEAQDQIATTVAMTVEAQNEEAMAQEPTATPVPVEPLPTLTPVLPTATAFTVVPPSSGSGGGGGSTTYAYSCDIIRQRPIDNTEYRRNDTFDVRFSILNNGTATWEAGKDLILLGNPGSTLINPPGTIELPEMKPGDTFAVGPFDAEAPDKAGHYVIDFKLEGGFCYPYVAFNVIQ